MIHDQIPLPSEHVKRFEQLGFGMFVHFGLYSQLNSGEWVYCIHKLEEGPYTALAKTFKVDTMAQIVATAKSAGCTYICLTTRHHEGFSLYDTRGLNEYDAVHSPCGRDLVAEFVEECRKADIVPFFYHTTLDWWRKDFQEDFDGYLDYLYKSVEILCTNYGPIGGLWFDGNWSKPGADWKEDRLYAMIRSHQPEAMIINNTGLDARGAMGAKEIDAVTFERGMPEPLDLRGKEKYVTGEMCETLCDHWGVADDLNFKSVKTLIEELCESRKVGANFLLNIGPNADGSVSKIQAGTMECIGRWMAVYGKAIYNGRPGITYPDKREFVLKDIKDMDTAYLFCFDLRQKSGNAHVSLGFSEENATVLERFDRQVASVTWMDNGEALAFRQEEDVLSVNLTGFAYGQNLCVRVAEIKFA